MRSHSKPIGELEPEQGKEADYRAFGPMRVCPCGSDLWEVKSKFDDEGSIGLYFREMRCAICNSKAIAPIPGEQ